MKISEILSEDVSKVQKNGTSIGNEINNYADAAISLPPKPLEGRDDESG